MKQGNVYVECWTNRQTEKQTDRQMTPSHSPQWMLLLTMSLWLKCFLRARLTVSQYLSLSTSLASTPPYTHQLCRCHSRRSSLGDTPGRLPRHSCLWWGHALWSRCSFIIHVHGFCKYTCMYVCIYPVCWVACQYMQSLKPPPHMYVRMYIHNMYIPHTHTNIRTYMCILPVLVIYCMYTHEHWEKPAATRD